MTPQEQPAKLAHRSLLYEEPGLLEEKVDSETRARRIHNESLEQLVPESKEML